MGCLFLAVFLLLYLYIFLFSRAYSLDPFFIRYFHLNTSYIISNILPLGLKSLHSIHNHFCFSTPLNSPFHLILSTEYPFKKPGVLKFALAYGYGEVALKTKKCWVQRHLLRKFHTKMRYLFCCKCKSKCPHHLLATFSTKTFD